MNHYYIAPATTSRAHSRPKHASWWKRPTAWFGLVIAAFVVNVLVAVVTIEQHVSNFARQQQQQQQQTEPLYPGWKLPSTSRSSSSSSSTRPDAKHFSTERKLWHRLLLQQQQQQQPPPEQGALHITNRKYEAFRDNYEFGSCNHHTFRNRSNTADSGTFPGLPPLGFPRSVRAYVRTQREPSPGKTRQRANPSSLAANYCRAPPSEPLCESFRYTVLLYSGGGKRRGCESPCAANSTEPNAEDIRYWRNLVVTIMKFLAYPSVERVNLILRRDEGDENEMFHPFVPCSKNVTESAAAPLAAAAAAAGGGLSGRSPNSSNKYAGRIAQWKERGVVHVVSTESLWDALENLDVPSESVLWMDADREFEYSGVETYDAQSTAVTLGTVLKQRFRTWRERPSALVLPSSMRHQHDRSEGCPFPWLHGIIMHRNYLCYLNHPVVGSELRSFTDALRKPQRAEANTTTDTDTDTNTYTSKMAISGGDGTNNECGDQDVSWEATTIAMGMLLGTIGEGYVRHEQQWGDGRQTSGNDFGWEGGSAGIGDDRRRRMVSEELSDYFGCPCQGSAIPRWIASSEVQCTIGSGLRE